MMKEMSQKMMLINPYDLKDRENDLTHPNE